MLWTLLTYEEHKILSFLFKCSSTFLFALFFFFFFFFLKKKPPKKQGTSSRASQRPSSEIAERQAQQYNASLQRSWYWMVAALLWIAVIIPGSSGTFSDSCRPSAPSIPAFLQLRVKEMQFRFVSITLEMRNDLLVQCESYMWWLQCVSFREGELLAAFCAICVTDSGL